MRTFSTHGTGDFKREDFLSLGKNVIFEDGVKVWHPETISIGDNVYIGHNTMLKGHPKGKLVIEPNTWIGQNVFVHSAGSVHIESEVGIGPGVHILSSSHILSTPHLSILDSDLEFAPVRIEKGADLGVASVILPGITVGEGSQVGAGSVVTKNVPPMMIVAGNPAKELGKR